MPKIQPPTAIDIRLHALNLAAAQSSKAFMFDKDTDVAEGTLAIARQYRDWLTKGDEADTVPEPGTDDEAAKAVNV